jgi:hypothetical protein
MDIIKQGRLAMGGKLFLAFVMILLATFSGCSPQQENFVVQIVNDANGAFRENMLTCVTIPNGVTYIGEGAFAANKLTNIVIPNSVTRIGTWAFLENRFMVVSVPDTVTYICVEAFDRNVTLTRRTNDS